MERNINHKNIKKLGVIIVTVITVLVFTLFSRNMVSANDVPTAQVTLTQPQEQEYVILSDEEAQKQNAEQYQKLVAKSKEAQEAYTREYYTKIGIIIACSIGIVILTILGIRRFLRRSRIKIRIS